MNSEWRKTTIGDQVRLQRGFDITKLTQSEGRVPVVSTAGVLSYHDTAMANAPGVILGRKGNGIGRAHFITEDYWPHDTTLWVTDFKGNDPKFVFYFFRQQFTRLQSMDVGSANPTLNRNHVHPIAIDWPPLTEQKSIAHILGSLDDKIELNARMNATLEAMARALFQSWFVDFDPVRRNAEGGTSRPEDFLFPDSFEDSELGEIPKGWCCNPIADVCDINGWTLSKKDDLPNLEYVEISEVNRGDIANISNYSRGDEPSRARRRLRHGDTVLSTVRPDRGSYFLALNPPDNRVASTGFVVLTPTKAPWSYIHAAMTQPDVFEHLGHVADGGAYPAIRPEVVGAWKIAVPGNAKIFDAFHRTCAPLFEKAEANRIQSRTLANLRDTLLPKLLSGEALTLSLSL